MYSDFYSKHIQQAKVAGNLITGLCPFHQDSTPSFSAYLDSGVWACFGSCNLKGRSPEEFVARKMGVTLNDAAEILAASLGSKPQAAKKIKKEEDEGEKLVPDTEVNATHEALVSNSALLTELTNLRLWNLETIKKFSIGWDHRDDRIWIPVRGKDGWVDVRRYDWRHKSQQKFLAYGQGYGKPRPWPHAPEATEHILLVEGEPDCLLARSLGFNAYTSTGGAGAPAKMSARKVSILFDADEAGVKGADKTKTFLRRSCGEIRVAELPKWDGMPHNADFTDYIKSVPTALPDLTAMLEHLWRDEELDAPRSTLSAAIASRNFGKLLKVSAVSSGKILTPFQVPKSGVVVCPQGQSACKKCGIETSGGNHVFEIKSDSPKQIECTDEDSNKVRSVLREHLGIPKSCTVHEIETRDVQNLYNIRLTSLVELDRSNDRAPYTAIQAWSTEDVELNTPFIFTARALPDPKTQAGTLLITRVESDRTSLDDFLLTELQVKALQLFSPVMS